MHSEMSCQEGSGYYKEVSMDLKGKVALVTGAGSGISKAMASALAKAGAAIVAVDILGEQADETASELRAQGNSVIAARADVTLRADVKAALARGLAEFGQIDVLFNGAGINRRRPILEIAEDEWDAVLRVNLKGTFLCCQAVGRHMASRRRGRIINTAGHHTAGAPVPYATSKGGIIAFTQSLAAELKPFGVTVNAISPGPTDTPLWREGRTLEEIDTLLRRGGISQPGDMGSVVVYLASDASWPLTGQLIQRG